MRITSELFEAFLKCPTKCFLKSIAETGSGNAYADWFRIQNDSYRSLGIACLTAGAATEDCVVGLNGMENLNRVKWRLAVDLVASAQNLESRIHAVERISSDGRGKPAQFVPIRFIFANKLTRDDKLLLAFDSVVLSEMLGREVALGKIIHGDIQATMKVNTSGLAREVWKLIGQMTGLLTRSLSPDLRLNRHCVECEFRTRCRQRAIGKDDLSLLANMSEKERKGYHKKGIFSVTQLSYTFRPRRRPRRLRDKREKYHHSLKALAIREGKIHIVGSPELKIDGTPIYLDVEGLPDRDFFYLIGIRIPQGNAVVQHSLWADSVEDEKTIWNEFLCILARVENPTLVHYGSFENTFLKHMCQRHPGLAMDSFLERLVRNSINVLSLIFGRIYFPVYSNGLKDVARFLNFDWSEPNATGLQSVMWRAEWECSRDPSLKEKLVTYNTEDCEALMGATACVRDCCARQGANESISANDTVNVDSLPRETAFKFGKNQFVLPELEDINRAAYWDYQRERILLRPNHPRRKTGGVRAKGPRTSFRTNRTFQFPVPQNCPRCAQTKIYKHLPLHHDIIDVRFGPGGIKRWVTRYSFYRYRCPACHAVFQAPNRSFVDDTPSHAFGALLEPVGAGRPRAGHTFGHNLLALSAYLTIELGLPQARVAVFLNTIFGFGLTRRNINKFKASLAAFYKPTYEALLQRIVRGRLVHADETKVNLSRNCGYVWAFTSLEEVVYIYAPTRKGDLVATTLKDFKGVLVSDFYAAYESLECPHQKCLVHLIRDMNNDLLKEPFNDELKSLVADFAALVRPMIATADRFGLKKRFLRKHTSDVKRFFKRLLRRMYESETAAKCKARLEKNRRSLFTFLDYDGVPWNNNNAEHAIKAFAMLRRGFTGVSTENGIRDYLILLSLCQTCRFKGLSFLEFLRTGEWEQPFNSCP